jgi:mannosyltransferase OCH1-like enzyme
MIKTYEDLKKHQFKNDDEIPKIIFRTGCFKINELPKETVDAYEKEMIENKDYVLFYFDDEDCKKSIEESQNEKLIYAYSNLIPTAFKADLWRYYILHKYGGIYLDFSHVANIPYDDIIQDEKEIFVKDKLDEYGINNSFMICSKNNEVLKRAIEFCIYNVENKRYDLRFLEITGPQLLERAYRDVHNISSNIQYIEMGMPSIKHRLIDHDYSKEDTIVGIVNENNEEVVKVRGIQNHYSLLYKNFETLHYSGLYNDKLVYVNEKINNIKNLYRKLLHREADILGLINYYKCCSIKDIKLSILKSQEYRNLKQKHYIKTYKDLKGKVWTDGGIPKWIFRTGNLEYDDLPIKIKTMYKNILNNNIGYELFYFSDKDCIKFILEEYGQTYLDYYNTLIPTAYKADLFRYFLLNKYGGCYGDFTLLPIISYNEMIDGVDRVLVRDDGSGSKGSLWNALMCVKTADPIINKCIEICINHITNKYFGDSPLDITGPTVLGEAFRQVGYNSPNEFDIPLGDNRGSRIYIHDVELYVRDINDNRILHKKMKSLHNLILYNETNVHYDEAWNRGKIYTHGIKREKSISYAITVWNEHKEMDRLLHQLKSVLKNNDEIVIQMDDRATDEVKEVIKNHGLIGYPFSYNDNIMELKNSLNKLCTKDYIFQIDADEFLSDKLLIEIENLRNDFNVDAFIIPRVNTLVGESILEDYINNKCKEDLDDG